MRSQKPNVHRVEAAKPTARMECVRKEVETVTAMSQTPSGGHFVHEEPGHHACHYAQNRDDAICGGRLEVLALDVARAHPIEASSHTPVAECASIPIFAGTGFTAAAAAGAALEEEVVVRRVRC